ncbi:MAG: hypothetical protein ACJA1C_001204 [Crocinitomicaceae bacterium]|jgi:hypothetical protein
MAIIKEIKGHELYLWMNGKLIYKKCLDSGASKVFDVMAYDKYTFASITELDLKKTPQIIYVKAFLKMKTTSDGGRETGFKSGLRPNHVFEYENGKILSVYIGDIQFEAQELIMPGEEKEVTIRFLFHQPIEQYLHIGRKWWIHEGSKCTGEAEILEIELPAI